MDKWKTLFQKKKKYTTNAQTQALVAYNPNAHKYLFPHEENLFTPRSRENQALQNPGLIPYNKGKYYIIHHWKYYGDSNTTLQVFSRQGYMFELQCIDKLKPHS